MFFYKPLISLDFFTYFFDLFGRKSPKNFPEEPVVATEKKHQLLEKNHESAVEYSKSPKKIDSF